MVRPEGGLGSCQPGFLYKLVRRAEPFFESRAQGVV